MAGCLVCLPQNEWVCDIEMDSERGSRRERECSGEEHCGCVCVCVRVCLCTCVSAQEQGVLINIF